MDNYNGYNNYNNYDFNQQPSFNGQTKYCKNCGASLHIDAVVCPRCGCATESLQKESSALGVCAIVFSVLSGFVGLVLGIIGLLLYKDPRNRKNCKIAIGIFIAWVVLAIIIYVVVIVIIVNAFGSASSGWQDMIGMLARMI